ncbi:MAG: cytochrome c oxidase subunit II [Chloroflexota bacterium]
MFGQRLTRIIGPSLLVLSILLTGCTRSVGPMDWLGPVAGDQAEHQRWITWYLLYLGAAVFVFVEGWLLYSIIKFRRPLGPSVLPPQIHGHRTVEILWTVIPTLIVGAIAVPSVPAIFAFAQPPDEAGALRVEVLAHQWWWEFRYPDIVAGKTITVANELRIPVGRTVIATLSSADVIHSFWVPKLSGKVDVIPGRQKNQIWFNAREPGEYYGWCAEFCGTQHAQMRFRVKALAPAEFEAWVRARLSPPPEPQGAARQGYELFGARGCGGCHTVEGTPYQGKVGPNLTNIGERSTVAAGVLANDPDGRGLFRWIKNPQEVKPGAKMPNLGLSDADVGAIVAYLKTLK